MKRPYIRKADPDGLTVYTPGHRISVLVKFTPEQLAAVDVARGSQPRMGWIVNACMAKASESSGPPPSPRPGGRERGAREEDGPSPSRSERPYRTYSPNAGKISGSQALTLADVRAHEKPGSRLKVKK